MITGKRVRVLLHASAGILVILLSILADDILGHPPEWGAIESATLVIGLMIIFIGLIIPNGPLAGTSTNFCLSLVSFLLVLSIAEGFFRIVGFDFAREEQAWLSTPPFYRQPTVPTGEVFFRRHGPQQWTGQVLNTQLRQYHVSPNPYENEHAISIRYNSTGFRNPDDMADWKVAVAGDSFTELGYLPHEQLFTTLLGKMLNTGVLNLGTSQTGPLTHLNYLQDYGITSGTEHAVIVFFEGNDLWDLATEYEAMVRWQQTGQRDYREFTRQPSMLRALDELVIRSARAWKERHTPVHGYFKSTDGKVPVTLTYTPLDRSQVSAEALDHLSYFFSTYAAFGKKQQIKLWLVYMPCKRRVLHGQIEFTDGAEARLKRWQPTDLPALIAELSARYGVGFIDLTPALVKETKSSRSLVFNSIYDTHLNAKGSLVVAREMARHLAAMGTPIE